MNDMFANLFGQAPSYLSLLGDPSEANQQARQQGLLAAGLSLLSGAGPSTQKQSLGQLLAQGMVAGQKATRDEYARAMQDKMFGMKIGEMQREMAEADAVRRLTPSLFRTEVTPGQNLMYGKPTEGVLRDDEGNMMPGAQEIPQMVRPMLDMATLQQMLVAAPKSTAPILASLDAFKKFSAPAYQKLAAGEVLLDENGQMVAQGLPKEDSLPSSFREFQLLKNEGYGGSYQQFLKEKAADSKMSVNLSDPTAVAKAQADLLKDWSGYVKQSGAAEVASRYAALPTLVAQANQGNAAADGAIIYAVGKIYDPSGAVQEGDKKTILGNPSIPQQVQLLAQQVFKGGSLTPEARNGLLNAVSSVVNERASALETERGSYLTLAKQLGGTGEILRNPFASLKLPSINAPGGKPALRILSVEPKK